MSQARTLSDDQYRSIIIAAAQRSIETKKKLVEECADEIVNAAKVIIRALREGRMIAFFGNGGSAADAQHISAELVGKFKAQRRPLNSVALTTNTSILTAIGNDFSFDEIFSRQISANLQEGDVAVGISTSGQSKNVIRAIEEATRIRAKTIALTGSNGSGMASLCDCCIIVPSTDTQRIQESHIMIGHVICEIVDEELRESASMKKTA